MPNWRKVIVSGSDASLNSLSAATYISASSFNGNLTGSVFGTSSWSSNAITASFVTGSIFTAGNLARSSSYAITASYAANAPTLQTGSIANTSFGGSPRTGSVVFSSPFASTNYVVSITGEDLRSWTVQSKTTAGFAINSNSTVALTGTTYWMASI